MRSTIVLGIVLLAPLAAACGSSDKPGSTAAAPAAATTAAVAPAATAAATSPALPDGLEGSWTRDLTAADLARTESFRAEGTNQTVPPLGRLTLKLAADQLTVVAPPDAFEIAELSTLSGDGSLEVLSYVDPYKASFCGPEAPQNASYTWKLTGAKLTLSPVEDRCADRNAMLSGSWTRGS
jgi:hypothetical protein